MPLKVKGNCSHSCKTQLTELLEEVPDVLEEAILAASAPRHANAKEVRNSYGRDLRRKWFGKKRGTVRHTFQDILTHITNHDVNINIHGSRCTGTAHAYTPDDQKQNIYLCPLFFTDTFFGQLSTIIHELTHLVRGTHDFELPDDEKEFSHGLTVESLAKLNSSEDREELKQKFRSYLRELPGENSVKSAYSYEYFIQDLLEEAWSSDLIAPVRK